MILTKLFVILLTILLILEMIKYFKNKLKPLREGAATMSGTMAMGAGTSGAGTSGAGMGTSPSASTAGGDAGQYTDPGLGKDPVYLSTLNASNITFLKNKVDELVGLKQQLNDLSAKVDQNSTAITQLGTQISDTANQAVGRDPNSTEPIPQASGLE
jgi:hypothetical protein